jgi:hypothetical protein
VYFCASMSRLIQSAIACKTNFTKKGAVVSLQQEAHDSLPPRRSKIKFHCWCYVVLDITSGSVLYQYLLQLLHQRGLHQNKLDAGRAVPFQVRWIKHPSDLACR